MTCNHEDTSDLGSLGLSAASSLLPLLTGGGEDRFRDALELLLNASMLLERQQHLRAEPHARSEERDGHANGFKERSLQTRLGQLNLRVPREQARLRRCGEAVSPSILRALSGAFGQSER